MGLVFLKRLDDGGIITIEYELGETVNDLKKKIQQYILRNEAIKYNIVQLILIGTGIQLQDDRQLYSYRNILHDGTIILRINKTL